MTYSKDKMSEFSRLLAHALRKPNDPEVLIKAASEILPFQAALCVINQRQAAPIYLCDTYVDVDAKQAVQRYVQSTYLLNPVYNAFLDDLVSGVYRMRDLAPDQWDSNLSQLDTNMSLDQAEEIGFLTQGWPARLEELVLVHRQSEDLMIEISFAQPVTLGGFTAEMVDELMVFFPLFAVALDAICTYAKKYNVGSSRLDVQLEAFAQDILTPRENEVIQLILKGHSGKSICQSLGITMPTLKSHRKNAYAKLDIASQRELFNAFMFWKHQLNMN